MSASTDTPRVGVPDAEGDHFFRGVPVAEFLDDFELAWVSRYLDDREIALQKQSLSLIHI